jgi:bifunctional DNA-binding transcriptional regulator/antitoxin component of YhaV-PrlF toxin-antitoxin module
MKIGERGQVTIPQHHLRRFGLKPAMVVEFVDLDGKLVLQKAGVRHKSGIRKFYGVLSLKNVRTDDLMKELRGR